jgi:hypothetical protein
MAKLIFRCHHCGAAVSLSHGEKVMRHHNCDRCDADLRCCRNCRYFDPGRSNQCSESQAEWTSNKESANFCDYFEPLMAIDRLEAGGDQAADDPRKKFDDLFK